MDFQRLKSEGGLTVEQLEGYIICLKDKVEELNIDIERYSEALELRKNGL